MRRISQDSRTDRIDFSDPFGRIDGVGGALLGKHRRRNKPAGVSDERTGTAPRLNVWTFRTRDASSWFGPRAQRGSHVREMEWREPSAVGHSEAYLEARRWIEAVTEKRFGTSDFRSALENGVLLCDLINKIKPGTIKRVNTLPTPIAGLDNLNVFLKACGKLGLKEAQLFHPGDLQDLSTRVTVKLQETNRRLKNVLITIYWLGRRAQCDHVFDGPYLNFKAFEGLLGTALYKALQETSSQKGSNVRDSGFGDSWCSEREELCHLRGHGGGGGGHKRDDSLDSLDSLGSRPHSISSDTTLKGSSEGCCSDTEADSGFRMADNKDTVSYRRSISITPKSSTHFNQFLPSKDKPLVYVPAPLRRRRAERYEDNRRSWANTTHAEDEGALTSSSSATNSRELQNAERSSGRTDRNRLVSTDSLFRETHDDSEDEDSDVGYADPVQDDLYARKMGVKAQPASNESFDKYLPKCWTPEEEAHIEKIKLGSQRRPWYKKMQGFSQKRSGSSSDDSDCDISPWLPSAHSPSGTSHSHSHSHEAMAHTTLVVGKSPHIQALTSPQLSKIQPPLLEPPTLVFAPVDPTSGPRLVKCERWPLYGRQDPREPPDPFDYESICPDLENDDMFARRTLAFQSNADLAAMKNQLPAKRRLYSSEPQLNIIVQQRGPSRTEEEDFPDIERDDLVYRKEKTQQAQRPPSGAPDHFAPMPIPEPWALPPDLKARLLCPPCPRIQEAAADKENQVETKARPKTDDMLVRKLGICSEESQSPSAKPMSPSVPSSCSEGDLHRWQAIREASQLRYKKRLLVERLATLKLLL